MVQKIAMKWYKKDFKSLFKCKEKTTKANFFGEDSKWKAIEKENVYVKIIHSA